MRRWSPTRAALTGGFIGGALDLAFAITLAYVNGALPARVLQTIASGLLGEGAYSGGATAAALGFVLHFLIALLFATMYVVASRRVERLTRNAIACGVIFGIGVFFVMRLIVLPLSAFPHPVMFKAVAWGLDLLSHMFLFGVPIALAARQSAAE